VRSGYISTQRDGYFANRELRSCRLGSREADMPEVKINVADTKRVYLDNMTIWHAGDVQESWEATNQNWFKNDTPNAILIDSPSLEFISRRWNKVESIKIRHLVPCSHKFILTRPKA
jgi:predicted metallo-beta-lactamase superfamily hydrolase